MLSRCHARLAEAAVLWLTLLAASSLVEELPPLISQLAATAYAAAVVIVAYHYSGSFLASLAAAGYAHYYASFLTYSPYTVYGSYAGVAYALVRQALRGGAYDPVAEYISWPSRPFISPLLAAAAAALIAWKTLGLGGYTYYPFLVGLGALIAARQENPLMAAAIALASSLGQYSTPALALYASKAPLPRLSCGSLELGLLVAYEAETSPARSPWRRLGSPGGRRRVMACSEPGPARAVFREPGTLWIYSRDAWRIIESASSLVGGRLLVVDLDSPGEGGLAEALKAAAEEGRVPAQHLSPGELEALITALSEEDIGALVIESCSLPPVETLKAASGRVPLLIVHSCQLPQTGLIPAPARGSNIAVVGSVDDVQALNTVISSLIAEDWDKVAGEVAGGKLLVTPYCGPRAALVDPGRRK